MNNKKQTYVAPEMEILEIEVEQGFAASTENMNDWIDNPAQSW